MNSLEVIKDAGFLPNSSMSLRYETNETDNVKQPYQLWDAEFVPVNKARNNIYILFRLDKKIFESSNKPWKYIQIVSINQQPRNEKKSKPEVENYAYEINLDLKFDEFNNLLKNYMISKNFSEQSKDKDIKTALFDIETWLMKTKDERANIQLENFKINNPNLHTFEIDEFTHDNLDILEFKLLIIHFLNVAKNSGFNQKDIQNTNFLKLINEFSDINLSLNFLESNEVSLENILQPSKVREQNDIEILLPLYICLTNPIEDQQRLQKALEKIGISKKIWQKTFESFTDQQQLFYDDMYNLNLQKNKYVFEFITQLIETFKQEAPAINAKSPRKLDLPHIQVIFSFVRTNDYLMRSQQENKITYQLSRKGKTFLRRQLNNI